HTHWLLFLAAGVEVEQFAGELYAAWERAAALQGLTMDRAHGLDVRATYGAVDDYVAKYGRTPANDRRPWGPEDELTKAHSKHGRGRRYTPFDLVGWYADTGESRSAHLFREFAGVFKGRRQLVWSPGLRARLGLGAELTDEQVAAAGVDDAVLLALLSRSEWAAIRWMNHRGEVLEVARQGDPLALRRFVAVLVDAYRVEIAGELGAAGGLPA
ncbi:MAG: hypothetical protein ACTHMP_25230, partial [Thermomicrobiales bacterium]